MEWAVAFSLLAIGSIVNCCTESFVKAKDGTVVSGRSMEYDFNLKANVTAYPKGIPIQGFAPSFCKSSDALQWNNAYDVICAGRTNPDICADGFNSAGLSCGLLVLSGTKYDATSPEDCKNILGNLQFCSFVLGNYNSTRDVSKAMKEGQFPKLFSMRYKVIPGYDFELHFPMVDASGDSIVVEYTKNGRKIHQNTVHVVTNEPTYDFQLMNLNNFVQLTKYSQPPTNFGGVKIKPFGLGSGLLGIPGDYSPMSRFVRTAAILHFSDEPETADEAVNFEFHMLNIVDIPKGPVHIGLVEYTQWIVVRDLKNLVYYIRSYGDQMIRKFDLKKIRRDVVGTVVLERKLNGHIPDVTKDLYSDSYEE